MVLRMVSIALGLGLVAGTGDQFVSDQIQNNGAFPLCLNSNPAADGGPARQAIADECAPIADPNGSTGWYFANDSPCLDEKGDTSTSNKINWYYYSADPQNPETVSSITNTAVLVRLDGTDVPFINIYSNAFASRWVFSYQGSTAVVPGTTYLLHVGEAPGASTLPGVPRLQLTTDVGTTVVTEDPNVAQLFLQSIATNSAASNGAAKVLVQNVMQLRDDGETNLVFVANKDPVDYADLSSLSSCKSDAIVDGGPQEDVAIVQSAFAITGETCTPEIAKKVADVYVEQTEAVAATGTCRDGPSCSLTDCPPESDSCFTDLDDACYDACQTNCVGSVVLGDTKRRLVEAFMVVVVAEYASDEDAAAAVVTYASDEFAGQVEASVQEVDATAEVNNLDEVEIIQLINPERVWTRVGPPNSRCERPRMTSHVKTRNECQQQAEDAGVLFYSYGQRSSGLHRCDLAETCDLPTIGATKYGWRVYHAVPASPLWGQAGGGNSRTRCETPRDTHLVGSRRECQLIAEDYGYDFYSFARRSSGFHRCDIAEFCDSPTMFGTKYDWTVFARDA